MAKAIPIRKVAFFLSSSSGILVSDAVTFLSEKFKNCLCNRVRGYVPFWMPLHAELDVRRVRDRHGLYQIVRRTGLGSQARRKSFNSLCVQRIDPDPIAAKYPF